jgi:hypothetical protein
VLVLPPPIVCTKCNGSFRKIEQLFAEEPEFNFRAALLGPPNARTGKPFTHDRFGVAELLSRRDPETHRNYVADINLNLHGATQIELVPQLSINRIVPLLPSASVRVTSRWLGLYSRSVHKILFEWYAYLYYVTGQIPEQCGAPTDDRFNDIRRLVRCGEPQGKPRMVIRWHETIDNAMNFQIDSNSDVLLVEMNLLGTHYIAALVGDGAAAEEGLTELIPRVPGTALVFSDELRVTGPTGSSVTTIWRPGTVDAPIQSTPTE